MEKLIAIFGLVISSATLISSLRQNEAADLQAKAAVAQLEPQLNLVKEFLDDYKTEQIVIRNHQGLMSPPKIPIHS